MAVYEPVNDDVLGGVTLGEGGEIADVVLTEDREGDPVVKLYIDIGSRALNWKNLSDGSEAIPTSQETSQSYFGGLGEDDDKKKLRRKIALEQLGKLAGEKLEDGEETILRFSPDHPDSLVSKIVGKKVWLRAVESGTKIYFNLFFPREKATPTSMAEMRARLAKKRAAAAPY